jgi:hypothetical protein
MKHAKKVMRKGFSIFKSAPCEWYAEKSEILYARRIRVRTNSFA